MSEDPRRLVPRTDTLLADPRLAEAGRRLGRGLVKDVVQRVQQQVRNGEVAPPDAVDAVLAALPASERERLNVLACEQDQGFDAAAMCACWQQSGVSARLITGEGHMFPLRDPRRFAGTLLGLIA